jgi:pimeloyl-ACP methyl ester carboxylesterase
VRRCSAAIAVVLSAVIAVVPTGKPVRAAVLSCTTDQLHQVPGPAPALVGSVPVVFIHGITSSPAMWGPSSPSSIAGQAAKVSGVTVWTFGYAPESLDWVTDQAIGPAFASALACLAHVSGRKVIVVAHSMGGLATQYALAQPDPYGGTVASRVAEVVTLGTPYDGSTLLTVMQALRFGTKGSAPVAYTVAARAILSLCAGQTSGFCGLLNIMPSQVGTDLETGSSAIAKLPPWPHGLPVLDTAGDMDLRFGIGSLGFQVNFGDGPVTLGSATDHNTAGPPVVLHCNAVQSLLTAEYLLNPGPCFHTHLAQDAVIIAAVLSVIRTASIQKLNLQLVPDPPFGPGYTTSGDYLQVSGILGLASVNAALRNLVVADEAAIRSNFGRYGPPHPGVGPGSYGSAPDEGEISASSAVVSVLTPAVGIYPGGNDGEHWISATFLVPSAQQITLPSLFASQLQGLAALARLVRSSVLATNSCVQQAIASITAALGSSAAQVWLDGFNPTLNNYRSFAMTPAGLAIGIEQGQVADEACGNVETTIPWSQLQPYLSPLATQLIPKLR